MNISKTTPRFDKDYKSFTSTERNEIKLSKRRICTAPYPPDDSDWKELKQFKKDYPEGIVCALRINHFDRLVYELNLTTGEITFTNCRGHKYREKSYSDMEVKMRKLFAEIKPTCKTKGQKLAFNRLLNTFKFDTNS